MSVPATSIGYGTNPNRGEVSRKSLWMPNSRAETGIIPNPDLSQHPAVMSAELHWTHLCNPYRATTSVTAKQLATFMNKNLSMSPADVRPG